MFIHRRLHCALLTSLAICIALVGCSRKGTEKVFVSPSPSLLLVPAAHTTMQPTIKPTPTLSILGASYDTTLDLSEGPVAIPLEIEIPSLKVVAPMIGVGLKLNNAMDAPKGPYGDPLWHTAFWYRGSGVPGEVGTATVAGHVNDLVGRPEIFSRIRKLSPGDLIIIHVVGTTIDIRFVVDEVKNYSIKQSSEPEIHTRIFGSTLIAGNGPQPENDGLSHLTLITCAGDFIDGHFDHHTVVFATRKDEVEEVLPYPH